MALDPREATEARLGFDAEAVVLLVGPEQQRFTIHETVAQRSLFFRTALKKEWAGRERFVTLPYDESELISVYIQYLYTGKIACKTADTAEYAMHVEEGTLLAKLYVLAERFQDLSFKNTLVDAIIALSDPVGTQKGLFMTGPTVDILYQGTCERDPVRRLMVDIHIAFGLRNGIQDGGINNKEFLMDLCREAIDEQRRRLTGMIDGNCAYHKHDEGESCPFAL